MLFLYFGSCLGCVEWVSDGIECVLSGGRYFSGFGDFPRGFGCVMVQMLFIRALFGVLFCIGGRVILSSIR